MEGSVGELTGIDKGWQRVIFFLIQERNCSLNSFYLPVSIDDWSLGNTRYEILSEEVKI